MTYFVVSHVSHAWDRNTSYLKYLTVSQMYSKGVRAASRVVVELRPPQSEEAQGSGRPSRATKATPKAQESKSPGRKSKKARA